MLSKLQVQQQFKQRSNWRGFLTLSRDLFFLGAAWYLAAQWGESILLSIVLIGFIGAVQFALGESLLHEASHGNLFQTAWLNKLVGNLIAFSIFTTLKEWRQEHSTHHGHLLSEQDHLTHDYQAYQLDQGIAPFQLWVARPLLGRVGFQWLRSEGLGLFKHLGVFVGYSVVLLLVYYNNALGFFLLYWLLPLVWVYSSILYWSEITDHHLAASTTRTNTSFFWNFMFHNGGYHWVHHEYPFIPWYLLPTANQELKDVAVDQVSGWWGMYQVLVEDYQQKQP
ncbi:MAG: fatty acid desaturase family protein [Aureispira sp.]